MSLFNYFAIQTVFSKEFQKFGWKITEDKIKEVEEFFQPFLDGKNLVVTPRLAFAGRNISFRYCGLELLQLTYDNKYRLALEERDHKIRRAKQILEDSSLSKVRSLIEIVKPIIVQSDFMGQPREQRMIPGFSMEHWLESLILSDTEGGKRAREHLGINADLSKVVSQVPVVVTPSKIRRRALHIDLFSLNSDGKAVIVELKKDHNLPTAIIELQAYVDWFLHEKGTFDAELGTPEEMMREYYIPSGAYDYSPKGVEAVAVVVSPRENYKCSFVDKVKFRIVELPSDWWKKPDGNPFNI